MREAIRDIDRLKHILDAIDVIINFKEGLDYEAVTSNPITYFGFVKHIEIIGEAVYKLTKEFRQEHSELDWRIIESMRHILVHGYYQLEKPQIWKTIQEDVPELRPVIEKLYNEELSKRNS